MYLPFTSPAFLQFLQLPLLLSNSNQPEQLENRHGRKRINNLGNISPYHKVPSVPGVSADLPNDCTVDQVISASSQPDNEPTP